jgi:hypothetical protein
LQAGVVPYMHRSVFSMDAVISRMHGCIGA